MVELLRQSTDDDDRGTSVCARHRDIPGCIRGTARDKAQDPAKARVSHLRRHLAAAIPLLIAGMGAPAGEITVGWPGVPFEDKAAKAATVIDQFEKGLIDRAEARGTLGYGLGTEMGSPVKTEELSLIDSINRAGYPIVAMVAGGLISADEGRELLGFTGPAPEAPPQADTPPPPPTGPPGASEEVEMEFTIIYGFLTAHTLILAMLMAKK